MNHRGSSAIRCCPGPWLARHRQAWAVEATPQDSRHCCCSSATAGLHSSCAPAASWQGAPPAAGGHRARRSAARGGPAQWAGAATAAALGAGPKSCRRCPAARAALGSPGAGRGPPQGRCSQPAARCHVDAPACSLGLWEPDSHTALACERLDHNPVSLRCCRTARPQGWAAGCRTRLQAAVGEAGRPLSAVRGALGRACAPPCGHTAATAQLNAGSAAHSAQRPVRGQCRSDKARAATGCCRCWPPGSRAPEGQLVRCLQRHAGQPRTLDLPDATLEPW